MKTTFSDDRQNYYFLFKQTSVCCSYFINVGLYGWWCIESISRIIEVDRTGSHLWSIRSCLISLVLHENAGANAPLLGRIRNYNYC